MLKRGAAHASHSASHASHVQVLELEVFDRGLEVAADDPFDEDMSAQRQTGSAKSGQTRDPDGTRPGSITVTG